MNFFFEKILKWNDNIITLNIIIFVSFIIISFYNFQVGPVMSPDSEKFSNWADILISLNFNLVSYFNQNNFVNPNYIYTTPILLIALFKLLFNSNWILGFFIFNLILVFFSLCIFSKILLILKIRPLAISFGIICLTISSDLLIWPRYILSDTIFSFLILTIFYLCVKSIATKKIKYHIIFILILAFFTRPTSIPYIFAFTLFLIILKLNINLNPKKILLFAFFALIFIPFIFTGFYKITLIYFSENPQSSLIIKWVQLGQVIHDRPETWVENPNTLIDILNLYFLRLLFFFAPYVDSFSKIHILLNIFQMLVLIFSTIVWSLIGGKFDIFNKVVALIMLICIFVAAFHSYTIIDYDWRYRYPLIIPTLTLIPISIEILIKKLKQIFKS